MKKTPPPGRKHLPAAASGTAVLAVSFGTSHAATREKTIGAIEADFRNLFPGWEVRRAFTSGMIRNILSGRDGLETDSVSQALERLLEDGYRKVILQPTHVICGKEYHDVILDFQRFESRFEKAAIGAPLLRSAEDYEAVVRAVLEESAGLAGPETDPSAALVLMGHGTEHPMDAAYAALDYHFKEKGAGHVFVGTVEGYPGPEAVLRQVSAGAFRKAVLMPFMVVAGDHACNDMAGEERTSWKQRFLRAGFETECILKGLGELPAVRAIYRRHLEAAAAALEEADDRTAVYL